MKLSANFTLVELTASDTAERRGLDNTPDDTAVRNLAVLCEEILEPVRAALGRPIIVTSGYRSIMVNRAVGSNDRSQHTKGQAADFKVHGVAPLDVFVIVEALGLPFDQLIAEFGAWTHVSIAAPGSKPRRQLLTIDRKGSRPGLLAVRA